MLCGTVIVTLTGFLKTPGTLTFDSTSRSDG
jgi:hypothetical protein